MNPNNPTISCIMPAYNAERYIMTAIDSILCQTFRDFELIIINDGSTDNTEKIILSYKDPRIVYIKNERNLMLIKTLNKGIDVAKGRFISRMDSDDEALPNMFERELREFEMHPDAGIVNTLTYHMNAEGKGKRPNLQIFHTSPEVCSVVCFYYNMISHPGVIVKGDLMRKYRYNDNEAYLHFEDKELWCRMFLDGVKCYTTKERLLNYRECPTSINALYANKRYQRMQSFVSEYIMQRWGYEWHTLPIIVDFKTFMLNYNRLLHLWKYLKKNRHIGSSVYWDIQKWQIRTFAGIAKRLIVHNN